MALIVLVLLILLIATGALFAVLKIAFAVALGVFLALMAVGAYVAWRVRRAFRQALSPPQPRTRPGFQAGAESPPAVRGSSEVTVLRPDDQRSPDAE
jgi:membrane protein implicated in regulation of membrane protease activity